MYDVVFEMASCPDETVNRTSDYVEVVVRSPSLKKGVMRKFPKFRRKNLCWRLF